MDAAQRVQEADDMSALPLMIGGTALNALGGLLGGASANRAGRKARDFADRDLLGATGSLATQMYGDQASYLPTLRRLLGQAQQQNNTEEAARISQQIQQITRPTQDSLLGRMESTGSDIIRLQNDDLARFDADSRNVEGQFGAARDALATESGRLNELAAGGERMATSDALRMNMLAGGTESMARQSGAGRDRIIRRDSERRNKAMDATSRASLAGSGFGNTTAVPAAMQANARVNAEAEDSALQASRDARLAALMGARQHRVQTGQIGSAAVQDARRRQIGVGQEQAGAVYGADVNAANATAGRSSQRAGLRAGQLANEQALRFMPMQTELGVGQGSIMNPYQNANTAQYYPGASGGTNALASVGNTMTAAGGMILANPQQPTSQQRTMFNDYANNVFNPAWSFQGG